MKKKIFSMSAICAVVFAFVLTGCEPNDPSTFTVNHYTYDGQVVEVKWARCYHQTGAYEDYIIGLCPVVPAGSYLGDEPDLVEIGVWVDLLGQKASFNQSYDRIYALYGSLVIDGTYYGFGDKSYPSNANLSGSGNWVEITKQSDGTFTLEFSVVLYGKPFTGKCSGIEEDDGWWY